MTSEIKKRIADINSGKVPEGYKKTKVGIVPVEWDIVKLADIMHNEQRPIEKPKEVYTRIGIRSHAKGTFHELVENPEEVNMDTLYVVKKDDFIVNITFAWEHAIALASDDDDGKLVSHRFPTYVFDNNSPLYYKYVFCQDIFRQRLELISPGGAGRNRVLNKTDFINLEIYRPPLPEQQKIAEIISTQDKLIELEEKKIEQLKKLKKAYLQKMFPKKDSSYPEIRFKGFTDPWEQRKLSDILERRVEHRQQSEEYPRLAFASGQGVIPLSERKTNNREQLTKDEFAKKYLVTELDDIVYNPANVKYGAIDRNKYGRGLISPIYITFTTAEIPGFIERIVSSHEFQQRALKFEEGTVIKRQSVNPNDFVTLKILLSPYREEQEKISALFDNLDSLITLHQRKLEQEKQKKKALMQLLLTGKVRCV